MCTNRSRLSVEGKEAELSLRKKFKSNCRDRGGFPVDRLICRRERRWRVVKLVRRWAWMEEGVRRAGGGFLIQISCGLTQQSLESKVTLGSLTVLYANRATHLASGAGLLRGYLCKSD